MIEQRRPIQILLAEDNPMDALITKEALGSWKTKNVLHIVKNGQEALDFLLKRNEYSSAPHPDMILLDLNLPKRDAKEILSEIKKYPDLSSIPVIIVTTSDSTNDLEECHRLGASLFISKPTGLQDYVQALNSIQEFWLASYS